MRFYLQSRRNASVTIGTNFFNAFCTLLTLPAISLVVATKCVVRARMSVLVAIPKAAQSASIPALKEKDIVCIIIYYMEENVVYTCSRQCSAVPGLVMFNTYRGLDSVPVKHTVSVLRADMAEINLRMHLYISRNDCDAF